MPDNDNNVSVNDLGAMSPEKALEYMKKTENLVIVDVATRSWYAKEHFEGAINIPIENISPDEAENSISIFRQGALSYCIAVWEWSFPVLTARSKTASGHSGNLLYRRGSVVRRIQ